MTEEAGDTWRRAGKVNKNNNPEICEKRKNVRPSKESHVFVVFVAMFSHGVGEEEQISTMKGETRNGARWGTWVVDRTRLGKVG